MRATTTNEQTIFRSSLPRRASLALAWLLAIAALSGWHAAAPATADAAAPPSAERVWSPLQRKMANVVRPRHYGLQLATWYGPGFWGHRTGCGSTLTTRTWGVAHRTLPCGQLVWLRYRGRQIAVPVVDRGPFSGASLDLTGRTATYLHFQGAGRVRMSVLPRRIPIRSL